MGICRRLLSTTSSETAILCARCFGITQGGQCATKEQQDTQYQHHPPPDSEQFLILSGPLIISASGRPRAPPVSSLRGSIGSGQGRKPTLLYALAGASTSATSARAEPCAGLARIAHLRTHRLLGGKGAYYAMPPARSQAFAKAHPRLQDAAY